jgi:hypothetical protein
MQDKQKETQTDDDVKEKLRAAIVARELRYIQIHFQHRRSFSPTVRVEGTDRAPTTAGFSTARASARICGPGSRSVDTFETSPIVILF